VTRHVDTCVQLKESAESHKQQICQLENEGEHLVAQIRQRSYAV
jgi:predicted transcriptional regulator